MKFSKKMMFGAVAAGAIMETPLLFWEQMTVMIFMPVISAQ